MRKWPALMIAALAAALTAGSAHAVPSGDSCTYTADGSTYTVNIVTGSGVQQFGFAFATPGLTLTNAGISGQNGQFTTSKLPANTTGAWISDAPLTGNIVATLTGNGSATGPIAIVPSAASQSSWFDAVTCAAGAPVEKTVSFTVGSRATYSTAARGWHLVVTIPAAGTVSAKQPLAKSFEVRPKPLVIAKRQSLTTPGTVTLLLKTTPQGDTQLMSRGVLRVKLTVTVDTRDGREGHKTISLTLRR